MAESPKGKQAARAGTRSESQAKRPRKKPSLNREAWLAAARQALIQEGTAGVEVNKLAKRLGSSRSSFYWFFEDRAQLLTQLLGYWAQSSTQLLEQIALEHAHDGMAAYRAVGNFWLDEVRYDPKWDGAVRDWARTSEPVRKVVENVDQKRIAILERIFLCLGYIGLDAQVRARIMYYHQVGYYAMGVHETRKQRRALLPYYRRALTGRDD